MSCPLISERDDVTCSICEFYDEEVNGCHLKNSLSTGEHAAPEPLAMWPNGTPNLMKIRVSR